MPSLLVIIQSLGYLLAFGGMIILMISSMISAFKYVLPSPRARHDVLAGWKATPRKFKRIYICCCLSICIGIALYSMFGAPSWLRLDDAEESVPAKATERPAP